MAFESLIVKQIIIPEFLEYLKFRETGKLMVFDDPEIYADDEGNVSLECAFDELNFSNPTKKVFSNAFYYCGCEGMTFNEALKAVGQNLPQIEERITEGILRGVIDLDGNLPVS